MGLNLDFSHSIENSGFQIILTIINQYELNSKDIQLVELIMTAEFEIEEIESVLEVIDGNLRIPDVLLTSLTSITYSSARGIVFAKTQGSFMNQFLLPVLDPSLIVQQKLNSIKELNKI